MCALVTGVQTCALPICADARLLRPGAEQASVAAAFEVARDHPARALLDEQGIELEDLLVLRRVLTGDGRSRAYVHDQIGRASCRDRGCQAVSISVVRGTLPKTKNITVTHPHPQP